VDAAEARMVGQWAVRYAVAGSIDGSVALRRFEDNGRYTCDCFLTPLDTVAGKTKVLPQEFIHRDGNDVTPAFIEYAKPLIGTLPPVARLAGRPVPKR
jgi:6-phosphofructokinase 1